MVSHNGRSVWVSAIVASCVLFDFAFLRPTDLVAQTPKTPQRTIQVRVVDPDGKPVAATKIHAGIWTNEPSFKHNRDYVCDSSGQAWWNCRALSISSASGPTRTATCRCSPIGNRRNSTPIRMRFPNSSPSISRRARRSAAS